MFETDLAIRLKELRLNNNLTQQKVADYLGITRVAYTYYELAKTEPNLQNIKKLAQLYKIPINKLLE